MNSKASHLKSLQALLPRPRGADERGSALIISLMIMVILTMMGVTFLVLSEQENKISINSRDHAQALYLAEAAVNVGLTWFNDPSSTNNFLPSASQMNRTLRKGRVFAESWTNDDERAAGITDTDDAVDGSAGAIYTGGTSGGSGGTDPFEKPYRGDYAFGLWGRRDTPDVLLCGSSTLDVDGDGTTDCSGAMAAYMTDLNNTLLMSTPLRTDGHSSRDYGVLEIEQIRVYRPPIDFSLKTRYGIATIEATAVKRVRNQVVARRTIREVIQEIPFPGPGGAIETDGVLGFAGSSEVHWGAVVSSSTDDDISLPNEGNANFPDPAVARDTSARFGFHYTINPAAYADFDANTGATPRTTWLTEALGITYMGTAVTSNWARVYIPDPWLLFRARRQVRPGGNNYGTSVQPFSYPNSFLGTSITGNAANREFDNNSKANWSHMFQKQIVRFPPIDYDTWKAISQSGQQGMYYFKWDNGTSYRQDGIGTLRAWTAWLELYDTGVFFFDTKDSKKPLADGSNLTPAHGWNPGMYIEGFIYVNSVAFDSTGAGNAATRPLNMPGEPFLDDGIDLHEPGESEGDNCICLRFDAEEGCVLGARPIRYPGFVPANKDGDDLTCLPNVLNLPSMTDSVARREAQTYRNGLWDSDLDNDGVSDASTDITANSGWNRFTQANGTGTLTGGHGYALGLLPGYPAGLRHQQGQAADSWKRDPRFMNDVDTLTPVESVSDRQPHEPFLNFNSATDGGTVADWAGSGTGHGLQVDYEATGEAIKKNGGTVTEAMTRARDATGALVGLQPHVNGVMFFEGEYTGSGNINVYGSMLMRGGYTSTGSLEVWFNEDLVKGKFPPPEWRLPRVFSTARDAE